jgi:RNA polymerase sigma-70 factor (ECF subfamily)
LDKLRERNRNKIFLEEYKEHSLNELDKQVPIDRLSVQNIKEAIGLLPDNYRIIFSLHLIEGYDYQEISQITGIKESTIRTLYSRAKNKIKELIKG